MIITCPQCGCLADKPAGAVNRSKSKGAPIYCGKVCASIGRRKPEKPPSQRKAEKAEYDRQYRAKNAGILRKKKADYYQRTADREKEREYRKKVMRRHVEYCRRPEYKAYKSQYDKRYRAQKYYGDFAECALVLRELETAVLDRASRYQLQFESGKLNKAKKRKDEYVKSISC